VLTTQLTHSDSLRKESRLKNGSGCFFLFPLNQNSAQIGWTLFTLKLTILLM
jgi:hypothetical protein